jgi:hypothetical protein
MSQLSAVSRLRGLARPGLVVVTGVLALTLAACGGGATPTAGGGPTTTPNSAPSKSANTPPPGAFGTAAAVSATNVEVQNPQSGQVTVDFNSSTTFTNTVAATLADVKAGSCVAVVASSGNMQTMTARTVAISQPTANGCTAGGFGGGGNFRAGGASRSPNPSRRPRPSGTPNPNAGRIAFGSVTVVQSGGFTVKDVARGQQAAQTTVVQTNTTTTFTQTQTATSAALAVGVCVAALGPSDDTGAITAKSISITKPGPSGCTQGFGGRGFRGGTGGSEGGANPSAIPGGGNG